MNENSALISTSTPSLSFSSTVTSPSSTSTSSLPTTNQQAAKRRRRQTTASTIITRLKSFSNRSTTLEKNEWHETHVDPYHSAGRVTFEDAAERLQRGNNAIDNDNDNGVSSSSDDDDDDHDDDIESSQKPPATPTYLWHQVRVPVCVILIGFLSALVTTVINSLSKSLFSFRRFLVMSGFDFYGGSSSSSSNNTYANQVEAGSESEFHDDHQSSYNNFNILIYIIFSVSLAALSSLLTQLISPAAVGGGIPEIKSLLLGSYKRSLVTPSTILAKCVGLVLAFGAGLSVGKEGPLVHVSVALSDSLLRTSLFTPLRRHDALRLEILGCAAAAGVATTFGTPFAATIFSIEVTGRYFMVRNLPLTFLCAVSGTLSMKFLNSTGSGDGGSFQLFGDLPKMAKGYNFWDLLRFGGLGAICGLLGVLFIEGVGKMVKLRNNFLDEGVWGGVVVKRRRLAFVCTITLFVSPFMYLDVLYGADHQGDQQSMTNYMFDVQPLGLQPLLLLYLPFVFLTTILCVTLPLPVGLFTPVFLIGSTLGRVLGEILFLLRLSGDTMPWEMALIGAAGFSAGVTRAISTAVILLELSGEHHLKTPIGVAVLTAYYIGNFYTQNIYDALGTIGGNPQELELPRMLEEVIVEEVMKEYRVDDGGVIDLEMTVRNAARLIGNLNKTNQSLSDSSVLPVVESRSNMVLIGAVRVRDLRLSIEHIARTSGIVGENFQGSHPLLDEKISFVAFNKGEIQRFGTSAGGRNGGFIKPAEWNVPIDESPHRMLTTLKMSRVHLVFSMLKINQSFVTKTRGELVGVVHRSRLRAWLGEEKSK